MTFDINALQRYTRASRQTARAERGLVHPPSQSDLVLIGVGNSGEGLTLRVQALGYNEGEYIRAFGLNNDRLAPRPLAVRQPEGKTARLELTERLILGDDNPRDLVRSYPLLERRYERLLRGIPVFETYPRPGHGGHGHPVISALDMDLHIDEVVAFLRRALRDLKGVSTFGQGQSHWESLRQKYLQQAQVRRDKRIIVLGGGAGSMGNAAHHLVPYLVRHILADLDIATFELWGVVLGPRAFTGLTPFIRHNYRALMLSLDHLTRYGQRRAYINDLVIDLQQPPYDRVLVMDDLQLPGEGTRVSEVEMDQFLDRTAVSLYLLLRGNVWESVASFTANPDRASDQEETRPRYLTTVQGTLAGVDSGQLTQVLAAHLEGQILHTLTSRLAA